MQSSNVTAFRDALDLRMSGPEMVIIPPGVFLMGSPLDEAGRHDDEGPQHEVTIKNAFAMSRHPIQMTEFQKFVAASSYTTDAEMHGHSRIYSAGQWCRGEGVHFRHDYRGQMAEDTPLPVVHVSWNDASAYVEWLSAATGETYALPSEAQFEFSNRAGTTTKYWWGNGNPSDFLVNVSGAHKDPSTGYGFDEAFAKYKSGWWGVSPIGRFKPNAFGLHDTSGNVWEWVRDCWHMNYENAPLDGSPWLDEDDGDCEVRVLRGGSWCDSPVALRSAFRARFSRSGHCENVGFRVVRKL